MKEEIKISKLLRALSNYIYYDCDNPKDIFTYIAVMVFNHHLNDGGVEGEELEDLLENFITELEKTEE